MCAAAGWFACSVIALIRVQFCCPFGQIIDAEMTMKNTVMNEDIAGIVLLLGSELVEVAGGGGMALMPEVTVELIGPSPWPLPPK
jgi:hypothetical protein